MAIKGEIYVRHDLIYNPHCLHDLEKLEENREQISELIENKIELTKMKGTSGEIKKIKELGIIEEIEGTSDPVLYKLTEKGEEFLQLHNKRKETLSETRELIESLQKGDSNGSA